MLRQLAEEIRRLQQNIDLEEKLKCRLERHEHHEDAEAEEARARREESEHRAETVHDINALLNRELKPDPLSGSLRIQIENADRNIWPLFKDAHYRSCNKDLMVSCHVFVATLPDHGHGACEMVPDRSMMLGGV
jgi:hypothetical protein